MRDRDQATFDHFYRETAQRVIHLVYAATGDLTLAQDATQEAYARAWRDWRQVSAAENPLSWVRTVARRIAISEWRRSEARGRAYTRHGLPSDSAAPSETRVAVVTALRELSPVLRETVALHYLADRSIEQIADELQVPVGTVKARLHRGRTQLRDLLQPASRPASLPREENRHE